MLRVLIFLATCFLFAVDLASATEAKAPSVAVEAASFRLADPSLVVELAASEPRVVSPVSFAWDEFERLYVAEMADYPAQPGGGRIRRLEDVDGDGVYERATVFKSGIPFPTSVLPWNGGVFVAAAPNIWFFQDRDGDGVADTSKVVLTGFGEGNQQLRVNGLTYGMDNWIYGANGRSDGEIRRPSEPAGAAVSIRRHDFRFRPEDARVEAISGFSQFGLPRDDWGRRYPSWNTIPIRHVVLEERDLIRNPALVGADGVASILDTSDGGRVYPLAPPQRRFNGESIAYFNATCGPAILRSDEFGNAYKQNAFICEPLSGLVHRRILEPFGPTFVAKRAEPTSEFLASTHPWFRPVFAATGPEGALYVADFCREWVEHPQFVPVHLRKSVDFHVGHDYGRLWRIRPKRSGDRTSRPRRKLGELDTAGLVQALDDPIAFRRDTAQRLLAERRDMTAVPMLKRLLSSRVSSLSKAHALWALDSLNACDEATLLSSFDGDQSPRLQEQVLRIARTRSISANHFKKMIMAASESGDAATRLQAVLASSELGTEEAVSVLSRAADRDVDDPWMRTAILASAGKAATRLFVALDERHARWFGEYDSNRAKFLSNLAELIGAGSDADLGAGLDWATGETPASNDYVRIAVVSGLIQGYERRGMTFAKLAESPPRRLARRLATLGRLLESAKPIARDSDAPTPIRNRALFTIARSGSIEDAGIYLELMEPSSPAELRAEAVRSLISFDSRTAFDAVLERFTILPSDVRRMILAAAPASSALSSSLLTRLRASRELLTEINPSVRENLLRHRDATLRAGFVQVFQGIVKPSRLDALKRYEGIRPSEGDPRAGFTLFEKNCMSCHERHGRGRRVGPDLSGTASKPEEALLRDILDPNRDVSPDFVAYNLTTKGGQSISGLLVGETPLGVVIRKAEGADESFARSEIDELRSSGISLMPEGLEQSLNLKDMENLLAYLRSPEIPASPK